MTAHGRVTFPAARAAVSAVTGDIAILLVTSYHMRTCTALPTIMLRVVHLDDSPKNFQCQHFPSHVDSLSHMDSLSHVDSPESHGQPQSRGQPHSGQAMPHGLSAHICLGVKATSALRTFFFFFN